MFKLLADLRYEMKKITILLFLFSISSFSQITIEKPDSKKKTEQSLTVKFNKEIDLYEYIAAEQFLGLVGQELFFLPENSKYFRNKTNMKRKLFAKN